MISISDPRLWIGLTLGLLGSAGVVWAYFTWPRLRVTDFTGPVEVVDILIVGATRGFEISIPALRKSRGPLIRLVVGEEVVEVGGLRFQRVPQSPAGSLLPFLQGMTEAEPQNHLYHARGWAGAIFLALVPADSGGLVVTWIVVRKRLWSRHDERGFSAAE